MASRQSTRASSSQGGSAVNDSFASLDPEELLQMLAGEDDDGEEEEGRDIVTDLDGRLAGAIGRPELECGLKRKRGAGNEEVVVVHGDESRNTATAGDGKEWHVRAQLAVATAGFAKRRRTAQQWESLTWKR
ncbi:hypothetical protein Esi_0122_0022 [Ectocarpus siliculosus]|uniref:Uncharacterized protein n=1 Tax=Ectocarpus siliculosus TaxID=2880 RepID=D7FIK8_ECTSI|nr:hypothetical protein Esi_0122_0022 [Ectocarpus siliculosus]|eukprot:CBJ28826.1 hypothetical protein Esi_0122_0022 [Ectocarpus siliculosus]